MPRPIYSPSDKIRQSYTQGKEYATADDRLEYIGPYHVYPNGAVFTGFKPSKFDRELIKYTTVFNDENTSRYAQITNRQYNNHTAPKYFYPKPTIKDYQAGFIERYFVQKKNDRSLIYEVSLNDFRNVNKQNKQGINGQLYSELRLKWLLVGSADDIFATNKRIVTANEQRMPGITRYLSDFTEFSK